METSEPLFSPERSKGTLRCFVCWERFEHNEKKISKIYDSGLTTFKEQAYRWSKIAIPTEIKEHHYTLVHSRITEKEEKSNEGQITVHSNCRTNFRNRISIFQHRYGVAKETECHLNEDADNEVSSQSPVKHATRRTVENVKTLERKCFICNEERIFDPNPYNEGGLGRCSREQTSAKLLLRRDIFIKDKHHRHYDAAKRLDILLSGSALDVFAADIFYHQSCYVKFVIKPVELVSAEELGKSKKEDVLNLFKYKLKTKIIRDKEAYLLHELLNDIKYLSMEQDLEPPAIEHTVTLKRFIVENFEEEIAFFPSGRHLLVHPVDINPCSYSVATLLGCGLRDADLVKAFGRLIRQKFRNRKSLDDTWPLTPEELLAKLDTGPLPELYNAIYYSMHDHGTLNQYGYAETSHIKATKIWSIASDWESLISRQRTPKQIILGMVLHRITGNKEAINALHKSNHVISYNDIRMQNLAWTRMVSSDPLHFPRFRKGVVTHSTIDNNDGRQETWTGVGTTHDTNKTLFQVPSLEETRLISVIGDKKQTLTLNDAISEWIPEPLPYQPPKRIGPGLFTNFSMEFETNHLDNALKRDIAWSLCGALSDDDLPLLGSWTPFNKRISSNDYESIVQEYLPVSPHPPEYPICKEYLDFLLDVIEELELPFMFVHSDEMVYAKLCDILWANKELYSKIVLLMGGFHQLRVMQRLLHKRHYCKGFIDWCIDAKTIAGGSALQAFEGRHYYRSMRVHKELFDALVQYKIETSTDNLKKLSTPMKAVIKSMRALPSAETFQQLLELNEFTELVDNVLQCETGSDADLTVSYLRDVSLMLSLVAAVRDTDIEKHLQAEQRMICYSFAYDHQNYSRYNSYQNVYLTSLKQANHEAFQQLKLKGIGGSITGDRFSAIHGDLITELFNKETKGTAGPFRSGFSTNTDSVNTWVNTIHIHTMLRKSLHTVLHMKTSSKHKEITPRGKRLHFEHVSSLKSKLRDYGTNPFSSGPPKNIASGKEIEGIVVNDMSRAFEIGKKQFEAFVEDRLVEGSVSFFAPVKKNKLHTGIKKEKKTPNAVEILKEDCQAFGTIIAKSLSLEEAFQYPITSLPLSVASLDGNLRQSEKASFRNYLIVQSNATSTSTPKKASWLVDGMAAVQALKPKNTYGEWIESLLRFITPTASAEAVLFAMVNDTYKQLSVKSGTRKLRGDKLPRTFVEGYDQHMPSGIKWHEFLRNSENKKQLLELITKYVVSDNRRLFKTPFIVTEGEKIYRIENGTQVEKDCNHEEADTRLIAIALEENNDVVVVCKDTDVLVLLVWAYVKFNVQHKWYFKYDAEKYAEISVICNFLGLDVCFSLPAFHAITGCDTTSYFYRTGKLRVLKKVLADNKKINLLVALGSTSNLTPADFDNVKEFIRSTVYSGTMADDFVQTRIRLYKGLKKKSSMLLPPDPDSVNQVVKRAHYQAYEWYHCNDFMIDHLDYKKWGWKIENSEIRPVWFCGSQFPPSVRNVQGRKKQPISEADDEFDNTDLQPPCKKARDKRLRGVKRKSKRKRTGWKEKLDKQQASTSESFGDESEKDANENDWELSENKESEWEVSDFMSSDSSCDEWLP